MSHSNLARQRSVSNLIEGMECRPVTGDMLDKDEYLNAQHGQSPALELQRRLEHAVMESFGNRVEAPLRTSRIDIVQILLIACTSWACIFGISYYLSF